MNALQSKALIIELSELVNMGGSATMAYPRQVQHGRLAPGRHGPISMFYARGKR